MQGPENRCVSIQHETFVMCAEWLQTEREKVFICDFVQDGPEYFLSMVSEIHDREEMERNQCLWNDTCLSFQVDTS